MIDFFDYAYNKARIDPNKTKFKALQRFIIRSSANLILPIYYRLTSSSEKYKLNGSKKKEGNIIVSITSFPARINHLWKVVETILHQTIKPDRIIVWLSREQFPDFNSVPKSLIRLKKRGLEIYLCDGDLRSHKKYFYTLSNYPDDYCLIVDDDVFYNTHTIESLIGLRDKYPGCICCNDADVIMDEKKSVLEYKDWHILDVTKEFQMSDRILPIGVGGVLYPPRSLDKMVLDSKLFMEKCPRADDLWLWSMAKLKGTSFACSQNTYSYLPIIIRNNITLSTTNLSGGNDIQMKSILDFLDSINMSFNNI